MNSIKIIDESACTGCGICEDSCMEDVIRMDRERGKACIWYIEDCQGCYVCAKDCPREAITICQE
ncbi:MAG: 4Fe-4S binding protein [Chloroflexi bacterium]|nr:4Fe-4S binding protein [Chloroflexota bacterium]